MPTAQPAPMFGAWNEHWKNHPAGLPRAQYKPNTNPNTGAASVDAAWAAARQAAAQSTTPPAQQTPTTTTPTTTTPTPTTTTPTPSAGNGTGMTPTTGFASQYTPAMLQNLYENPWYVLPDVFQGISTSSPLYQQLRDIGADPLALYNMAKGANGVNMGGAEDFANWLAGTYQQLGTPGGQRIDPRQLLNNLFNAGDNSTLGQILGAGDMGTQVRTLYNLARDASSQLNPLAARGYQSALARLGDEYGNSQLGATADQSMSPAEWMRSRAPWLTLGG